MILRKFLNSENIPITTIKDKDKEIKLKGKRYFYKDKLKNRYILEIDILPNDVKNKLTVIMFNPSEFRKNNTFVDQTVTNIIKIANDTGYNSIKILNLITIIDSNSNNIKNNEIIDIDFILSEIDDTDLLVAWGNKGNIFIKNSKDAIKMTNKLKLKENIFTFCANKSKHYPKHPARLNLDCCRNCYGRTGKFTLKKFLLDNI